MPKYLYEAVINSEKLLIETELAKRIDIIKEEYLKESYEKKEIIETMKKLGRYIGEKQINEYIERIKKEEYDFVIKELIEKYYDKVYTTKNKVFQKTFYNKNEEECADEIVKYIFG